MYTASQRQRQIANQNSNVDNELGKQQSGDAAMIDNEFADAKMGDFDMDNDDFDGNMMEDDLNMSGQFSPPHEPNSQGRDFNFQNLVSSDKMRGPMLDTEQDSAYFDEVQNNFLDQQKQSFGQNVMPKSPIYEINDAPFSNQ